MRPQSHHSGFLTVAAGKPAEREQGTNDLVAALQRNTNIETLQLLGLDDLYAIPILEALRSNETLKIFVFSPRVSFSNAASHALHQLLESTTSIQRFELVHATFSERLFTRLLKAS